MSSKIRLKLGDFEVEFEGSEEYMKEGLLELIADVSDVITQTPIPSVPSGLRENGSDNGDSPELDMSTSTIAAQLNVKTGPELVIAACAHLTFVRGKETFSRRDIREEMKTASAYYSKNIGSNFAQYLTGLVKTGKLIQRSNDSYALHSTSRKELAQRLGH